MTRVHELIESEITFGAFMLTFWIGAIVFTMSAQITVYSLH
jgi:hypothetical protein